MVAISEHASANVCKILMIGRNGSGKTGSLVSLAKAGYKIRVLDLDNGTEILKNLLASDPAALARVDVETHMDEYMSPPVVAPGGSPMIPKTPLKGFSGAMACLSSWPGLGKPTEWGPDTVLVIDSLTMLGKFIMNHVLSVKGKLAQGIFGTDQGNPSQGDWGHAMELQENVLAMLYSKNIKCHVIVMSHITYLDDEAPGSLSKGFPSALGKKLPPKVGSYFNHTLIVEEEGIGAARQKVIKTKSTVQIDAKTSAPGKVQDS